MRKRYVALLVGATIGFAFAVPAFGSHTFTSLRALAERVDRTVRLVKTERAARADQDALTELGQFAAGADGVARGQVNCPAGTEISGGGAEFEGAPADSVLISSAPTSNGWRAAGKGAVDETFTVYAVCVDI
jgi:hypothetical protein